MMNLALAAQSLGASLVGSDAHFHSVSTDSRNIKPGSLFIALRGERFDAHEFIGAVASSGAAGAMVDAAALIEPTSLPLVVVDDTRVSLGKLAALWRAGFAIPLIAVAGSNGKTTVKEMIAAILREHFGAAAVLATEGNFNNDIGLPLTLLRLRESHRAAVVEIGMNHAGETANLGAMAGPTIAVVNNAQREHQEFMKSVAEVAREHAALPASLKRGGVAVINADDEHAALWRMAAAQAGASVRDFGLAAPGAGNAAPANTAAVHARYQLGQFSSSLLVQAPEGSVRIELPLPGLHNVRNALAAVAAAGAAGASLDAAARALAAFSAVKGRMQRLSTAGGAVLLDDSYNANPESVHAAIEVLAACAEPRVLVLGDMGEVGEQGPAFHAEAGEHARQARLTSLLAMGELTRHAQAAFGGGRHCATIDEIWGELRPYDRPGATLLVKGSRFMRMERVVEKLVGNAVAGGAH